MMRREQTFGTCARQGRWVIAMLAGLLVVPASAHADSYDCSAVVMYAFKEGVMEKVPDAGLVPHQNFRVDTARAFVRVGASVSGMKEFRFTNAAAIRPRGGWVGQLRDEAGLYRGTLELRPDLAFAANGSRAHNLDFIWSGTLSLRPEYVLTGTCTFAGA